MSKLKFFIVSFIVSFMVLISSFSYSNSSSKDICKRALELLDTPGSDFKQIIELELPVGAKGQDIRHTLYRCNKFKCYKVFSNSDPDLVKCANGHRLGGIGYFSEDGTNITKNKFCYKKRCKTVDNTTKHSVINFQSK